MTDRRTQDNLAYGLLSIVGLFVLVSLLALVVLAFKGTGMEGGRNVWAGLFSLATAMLGAVAGYIAGSNSRRNGNGGSGVP